MAEIKAITRRWGNSLGITLSREIVEREHLRENQPLVLEIKRVGDIRGLKGLVSFKKSTQQLKEEMRKGW